MVNSRASKYYFYCIKKERKKEKIDLVTVLVIKRELSIRDFKGNNQN